jgi:hypothetical protein
LTSGKIENKSKDFVISGIWAAFGPSSPGGDKRLIRRGTHADD